MALLMLYVTWMLLQFHQVLSVDHCVLQNGTRMDRSRQKLGTIPTDIMPDTVELILSFNNLPALPAGGFSQMNKLQLLDLSYNKIRTIEKGALRGLHVLCFLDLRGNQMDFCQAKLYPVSLFSTVPHLKVLHLEMNMETICMYRNENLFLPLSDIRDLSLDARQEPIHICQFGYGFSKMNLLEKLSIFSALNEGYEILEHTLSSFQHSRLHTVIIEGVGDIEPGSFSRLLNIKNIIIRKSPEVGLKKALMSLRGLENRNMTSIVLSGLNHNEPDLRKRETDNFYLGRDNLIYLENISVINIDLSNNNILGIDFWYIRGLKYRKHILTFNFGGNKLTSDEYSKLIVTIFHFPNVQHVDVSWTKGIVENRISGEEEINSLSNKTEPTHPIDTFNCSHNPRINLTSHLYNLVNLRVLDMAFTGVCSGMSSVPKQTWPRLKIFNISGCRLNELSPFGLFPELTILVAREANLNFALERDTNSLFFRGFPKLNFLDMAGNGITYLQLGIFTGLSLQVLDVSNNKLISLPPAIRSLTSLKKLDLSYNAITKLDSVDVKWIEQMALPNTLDTKSFTLTAQGNPFTCVCKTIQFVRWLLETELVFDIVNTSNCYFENGTQVSLLNLKDEFTNFSIGCVSQFWLTCAIALGCVVAVGIVVSIVGFRYRWNIKYWFLTKCKQKPGYEPIAENGYPFDAFVAYNHEDYNWACFRLRIALEEGKQQYRLCLHHRDFPVGESIQQNIVDAVNSSKKIILVITKKYLACDWGEFEIEMAGMRMVQEGKLNVIIAILLEEIPVRKMPRSLLNMWKHVTFLLWKDDPADERIFWARLLEAMAR